MSKRLRTIVSSIIAMVIIALMLPVIDYGYKHSYLGRGYENQVMAEGTAQDDDIDDVDNRPIDIDTYDAKLEKKLDVPDDYNGSKLMDNGKQYAIKVNRYRNVVTVYTCDEDGVYNIPVRAMVCSVGLNDGTPMGKFYMGDKHKWCLLVGDVWGQYAYRINGDIMFHSVPYTSIDKSSLEEDEYNKLGEAASKGCVRLSVIDAKWIYDNCPQGTMVEIFDSLYPGPMGVPDIENIDLENGNNNGWDPTDPDEENPYRGSEPAIYGAFDKTVELNTIYDSSCGVIAIGVDGKDISSKIKINGTVDTKTAGDYLIEYKVNDDGKEVSKLITITVKDTIKPVITYADTDIIVGKNDINSATFLDELVKSVKATDSGDELDWQAISVDLSQLEGQTEGRFKIYYYATDASGNISDPYEAEAILDTIPPVIEYNGDGKLSEKYVGNIDYLKTLVDVDDNVNISLLTVSIPLVANEDMKYIVVYTVKDNNNNVSTLSVDFQLTNK